MDRELDLPSILGLTGLKGSGKTTIADELPHPVYSFADKIRDVALILFGWSSYDMQDEDAKEEVDSYWALSPRASMQQIGMMCREQFGSNFWIRAMEKRLIGEPGCNGVVVIDDCRFPNEAEWIKQNGVVIGLDRPGVSLDSQHPSETNMIDHWEEMIDREVKNDRKPSYVATEVFRTYLQEQT